MASQLSWPTSSQIREFVSFNNGQHEPFNSKGDFRSSYLKTSLQREIYIEIQGKNNNCNPERPDAIKMYCKNRKLSVHLNLLKKKKETSLFLAKSDKSFWPNFENLLNMYHVSLSCVGVPVG